MSRENCSRKEQYCLRSRRLVVVLTCFRSRGMGSGKEGVEERFKDVLPEVEEDCFGAMLGRFADCLICFVALIRDWSLYVLLL